MIECRGIEKYFGEFLAVSDFSFQVPRGTVCALLGPNGAGKSTIVKMLTGLLKPTGGTAEVCGVSVTDPSLQNKVGILPESLALFDLLTIDEHLKLTGAAYKLKPSDIEARATQLLRILRLEQGKNTFIQECSYGMKKKTALAMALLPNPPALFLDEPFEGIDPVTAETIRLQLRAMAARGVTVLLTSHILSLVDRVADQVVMINHGEMVLDSQVSGLTKTLEELYFELIERSAGEDMEWLGTAAS